MDTIEKMKTRLKMAIINNTEAIIRGLICLITLPLAIPTYICILILSLLMNSNDVI